MNEVVTSESAAGAIRAAPIPCNSRAVINVGGGDLVSGLLSVREAERTAKE